MEQWFDGFGERIEWIFHTLPLSPLLFSGESGSFPTTRRGDGLSTEGSAGTVRGEDTMDRRFSPRTRGEDDPSPYETARAIRRESEAMFRL